MFWTTTPALTQRHLACWKTELNQRWSQPAPLLCLTLRRMTHHEVSRNNWKQVKIPKEWRNNFKIMAADMWMWRIEKIPFLLQNLDHLPFFRRIWILSSSSCSKEQPARAPLSSQIKWPFIHHVISFQKQPRVRINWFPLKNLDFAGENDALVCFTRWCFFFLKYVKLSGCKLLKNPKNKI